MKTYNEIKYLNYQDLAFFSGQSVTDCKFYIAAMLGIKEKNKAGIPKVKISDKIERDKVDFTLRSNSELEGADRMKYLCDFYNRGVDPATFMKFGENETFKKHLKFTGVNSILNEILNSDQLRKLQKKWLFANVYGKQRDKIGAKAESFLKQNQWASELVEKRANVSSL